MDWEEGIPDYSPEFCIIQGNGFIVGLYPMSTSSRYYFYGFAASQVSTVAELPYCHGVVLPVRSCKYVACQ